ncbi:RNA polymerase sigma-70 factor [Sabulilitoribacter arenilitoris]|uniref:RNA polymerase sigma-70 factor n=1 Tax=Wocania arenilitoris TaxID=2044858 RepID=A0AAE3EMT5_9FLAO|nr:RNA polymerase sigma-70 factor [Wocania arenilitoris]MCF7568280.1 RNA polymerase sigma-70 factor [Wocania arenilitoris]
MKIYDESDLLLIQNFKSGNSLAFKTLFEKHQAGLTAFINSYTNDSVLTQDIVQDAFVKLWDARKSINSEKSLSAYLYKIGYYTYINDYRRNKKKSEMIDSLTYKTLTDVQDDTSNDIKEERLKQVFTAIENLPPRCKEIFKMSKLQGYKYYEIAQMLEITEKAVESQMSIAFKKIRNAISKNGPLLLFLNFLVNNLMPKPYVKWFKYSKETSFKTF